MDVAVQLLHPAMLLTAGAQGLCTPIAPAVLLTAGARGLCTLIAPARLLRAGVRGLCTLIALWAFPWHVRVLRDHPFCLQCWDLLIQGELFFKLGFMLVSGSLPC